MKRRTFGQLSGTSILALSAVGRRALAQSIDPIELLKTTLTPMGAERAGNTAGTIPAWTGGFTAAPADWDPATQMVPDFFADESPLYVVDATNAEQYAEHLSEGVKALIKNGFSLKVYQTHRTAAAPQWVYDNIAANATRAKLDPAGGRLGFTGGYGGIPFPIPNAHDPLAAGAQIMWNHLTRWQGTYFSYNSPDFVVQNGITLMTGGGKTQNYYPYYDPKGSLAAYQGYQNMNHSISTEPATAVGTEIVARFATNPAQTPNILWELLQGQGRVRKAPELAYDTPSSFVDAISNYDELYGFNGALDRYDWKFLEKREVLVPYNNNGLRRTPSSVALTPKFMNPDVVRWELHRVWVVEATLHPGERNVLARRRMYVDEDNWTVCLADSWDGNNNIYKEDMTFNCVFPNLPGTILFNTMVYNLQTGVYASESGPFGNAPWNKPVSFAPVPIDEFRPQAMAAAASY